ncbi:MAG TPA: hypothetical protein VFK57_08005 [Vicinamibacterales bacterium]|nr:hypothetical protein [Vicinamibacterales bacterium]
MARFALIVVAGLAVAYAISLLPLDQIDAVGSAWAVTSKVFAYGVLGAAVVRALTGRDADDN